MNPKSKLPGQLLNAAWFFLASVLLVNSVLRQSFITNSSFEAGNCKFLLSS